MQQLEKEIEKHEKNRLQFGMNRVKISDGEFSPDS